MVNLSIFQAQFFGMSYTVSFLSSVRHKGFSFFKFRNTRAIEMSLERDMVGEKLSCQMAIFMKGIMLMDKDMER